MSTQQSGVVQRTKKFIPEVREEVRKVTWPSRKETMMTTVFVFIFALIAAIYFMVVDTVIHKIIHWFIDVATR